MVNFLYIYQTILDSSTISNRTNFEPGSQFNLVCTEFIILKPFSCTDNRDDLGLILTVTALVALVGVFFSRFCLKPLNAAAQETIYWVQLKSKRGLYTHLFQGTFCYMYVG